MFVSRISFVYVITRKNGISRVMLYIYSNGTILKLIYYIR